MRMANGICSRRERTEIAPASIVPLLTGVAVFHKRLGGLFRDAWYLLIVAALSTAALWIFIAPMAGILVIVTSLVTFAYFAAVRYDDTGHEHTDDRA